MQFLISENTLLKILAFPYQGRFIATPARKMPVQAVVGNIHSPADKPFGKRRLRPVEHLLPRGKPMQCLCFCCPELLRILSRLPVEFLVLSQGVYCGLLAEVRGRRDAQLLVHAWR